MLPAFIELPGGTEGNVEQSSQSSLMGFDHGTSQMQSESVDHGAARFRRVNTKMDLSEIWYGVVDWIYLTRDIILKRAP